MTYMEFRFVSRLRHCIDITKPGIARSQILTASIGFFVAKQTVTITPLYLYLILGTYFFAASGCAANSLIERDIDARMSRTQSRPLPTNKLSPQVALMVIAVCFIIGLLFISKTNGATLLLALLTFILYVACYTPLKQYSWTNTLVGALPGALPLIGGWTATGTPINISAIALFFTLFCWQIPHFYALSIMHKADYTMAKLKMLPLYPNGIRATKWHIAFFSFLMVISSLIPYFDSFLGHIYFFGMIILSCIFLVYSLKTLSDIHFYSKKLFVLSILYLPAWFILIIIDINSRFFLELIR